MKRLSNKKGSKTFIQVSKNHSHRIVKQSYGIVKQSYGIAKQSYGIVKQSYGIVNQSQGAVKHPLSERRKGGARAAGGAGFLPIRGLGKRTKGP